MSLSFTSLDMHLQSNRIERRNYKAAAMAINLDG
jgi:hypothetical protein